MPIRTESFIAKRLFFSRTGERYTSRPAVRVALAGMIIGVMVMVITICVVVGFKRTITSQVAGFGAHIQVVNFENNNTYELRPIPAPDSLLQSLRTIPHIRQVSTFLTKPGILKTDENFQGIVLKGTDYWDYFSACLLRGGLPSDARDVLLSSVLCRALQLDVDSSLYCYFVGDELRVRKFRVSGVYFTGFSDFDERFVLCDREVVRRLNAWDSVQVSGIELLVDNLRYLEQAADEVYYHTANRLTDDGEAYYTQTIEQVNPQIFAWLDLLDMNVVVIIVLMLCVSGFNIISGLIILILDSIRLIGTLKALGATDRFVRRIFLMQGAWLIGRGMLWGNVLALALCTLQYFTHLFALDPTTYYVSYVPVAFPWGWWLMLNAGIALVSMLTLLAPSAIASRVSPSRVMRFE